MKKLLFILSVIIFSACTKNNNDGPGKLSVKITDDPFNISFVESATVTINKVEVRKVNSDSFIVVSTDPKTFDLIQLRNGITDDLATIDIPQGSYDLVRLYVDEASLKLKDHGDAFRLKIPSGQQTGIKVFISPALTVDGGLTSELLLDFDLAKSFVMRGNLSHSATVNGFIFKPVIKASNVSTAGRIEGIVTDTLSAGLENARVYIAKDTVLASTFTDATGHYAFIGVPAGTYDVSAAKAAYDSVAAPNINVAAANRTTQNFILRGK
jgi:hypothetical protein